METRTLLKADVKTLLHEASKKWEVFAPFSEPSGDVNFRQPESADPGAFEGLTLDDLPTLIPPKRLFFPQSEKLFEFERGKIRETPHASPKLLFGMKSCDLAGLLFSDGFFAKDFPDAYYLSRANDRLTVVKGCLQPPRPGSCFCSSAGTGPFSSGGFDLQLVDLGDRYAVEVASEGGARFVADHARFFAIDGDLGAAIADTKAKAAKALGTGIEFGKAIELMATRDFEENYARIGERCIYCGACLYTCPTCSCFNVFDRAAGGSGARFRSWDGCVFEGYTREASGHNPRAKKASRTARRYEHKLKYDPLVAGRSGCVGCGRCLDSCPVGIGMSKFIREITQGTEEM